MAELKQRNSIHPKESKDKSENDVWKCEHCKHYFHKVDDQEKRLDEKQEKDWIDISKNIHANNEKNGTKKIYPNLEEEKTFLCLLCKGFADYKLKQLLVLSVIIIGILALIMMYWLSSFKKSFDVKVPDQYPLEIQLDQEAYKLERSFYSNQDEEIWPIILSGIKAVSKSQPNQPAVFMIIYNGLFVSKTTRCLAKDVSNLALKYLMLPNTSGKGPSMIIGKDLAKPYYIEDSGRILIDAKNEISKSGAMIVTDLQDVPPVVAKEFHYMCDKYSPLVAKAVYVFTLYIDDKLPYYKDWSKVAENSLRRLWKPHLSDEILEPLIARMTPSTIAITRELMSNIVRTC